MSETAERNSVIFIKEEKPESDCSEGSTDSKRMKLFKHSQEEVMEEH